MQAPAATPAGAFFLPRGFAPRTPLHALSLAASPARSDRVARSLRSLAASAPPPSDSRHAHLAPSQIANNIDRDVENRRRAPTYP